MTPQAGTLATAGAGQAGQAGRLAIPTNPNLNPDISFPWTEQPTGGGSCQQARFTGKFTCMVDHPILPEVFDVFLQMTMQGSSEAQLLNVNSQIVVFDQSTRVVVTANTMGILDCSKRLMTTNVIPTPSEPIPAERKLAWLTFNQQPIVTGELDGVYDPMTQVIAGDIVLVFDMAPKCIGKFSVRASP